MATNAANVRVGVTGGIYHAPLGTELPTDATSEISEAFLDVGYISEDGVTQSTSTDVENIVAWQNGDVVRKVQTSHDLTFQFSMLETTAENMGLYYADRDASDSVVKVTGSQSERKSWILELVDGDDVVRIVVPDGNVTERGDLTWANGEAVMYDVTITAYPDADGVKAYIYRDSGNNNGGGDNPSR